MGHIDVEKRKEWFKRRYERNRLWMQQYKVGNGCVDCGYNAHHAGLEFDHVGEKRYNIANMINGSLGALQREIANCELVCGTCHNIRTWNRKQVVDKPVDNL